MSDSVSAAEVYVWVKATREGVFGYCASLPAEVYLRVRDDFGWGSIRRTLVHAADCYYHWLAREALGRPAEHLDPEDYPDVARLRELFAKVDEIVSTYTARYPGEAFRQAQPQMVGRRTKPFLVSPLWLLTHTITHEFHHKGQVVAMGRILGFPPPETDLALPGG